MYPEILDWLAVEFREKGWSQKHMVRLILTSRTYRQSSRVSKDLLLRDPGTADVLRPDLVVRFGGLPTSKAVNLWLARHASWADQLSRT